MRLPSRMSAWLYDTYEPIRLAKGWPLRRRPRPLADKSDSELSALRQTINSELVRLAAERVGMVQDSELGEITELDEMAHALVMDLAVVDREKRHRQRKGASK